MKFGVVDRIEGKYVVILVGNKGLFKPLSLFKTVIKEGDVIDLQTFRVNRELTENKKKEARELLEKIFKN